MRLLKITSFLYLSTVMSSIFAQAILPEDMELDQLASQADLVFQGTVRDIKYKASVDGIPHTFVTYDVEDVIQGTYSKSQLTLRFVGGYMERNGKTIQLSVSHAPQIKAGEQGVLMVQGNDSEQCPLVGCSFGRFEFVNGQVVDAGGLVMAMNASGKVERVRNSTSHKAANSDSDFGPLASEQASDTSSGALMDTHSFVAHLRGLVTKNGSAKAASAKRVRSANISRAFNGPKITVGPPPGTDNDAQAASTQKGSEFDRWEVEELRKNGGNPIMKNKFPGNKGSAALNGGNK